MITVQFNNTKAEMNDSQVWAIITITREALPIVTAMVEDYLGSISIKGNYIFDYFVQSQMIKVDIWSVDRQSPITLDIFLIEGQITPNDNDRELISYSTNSKQEILRFIDDNKSYHLLKYLIRQI